MRSQAPQHCSRALSMHFQFRPPMQTGCRQAAICLRTRPPGVPRPWWSQSRLASCPTGPRTQTAGLAPCGRVSATNIEGGEMRASPDPASYLRTCALRKQMTQPAECNLVKSLCRSTSGLNWLFISGGCPPSGACSACWPVGCRLPAEDSRAHAGNETATIFSNTRP